MARREGAGRGASGLIWLEGGPSIGYGRCVIDLDRCGMMHRVFGLVIDGNGLASDAFPDVGPDLAFLGAAHTMANFETANYESLPCDTSPHQSPHFKQITLRDFRGGSLCDNSA